MFDRISLKATFWITIVVSTVTFVVLLFVLPTSCNPLIGPCDGASTLAVFLQALAASGVGALVAIAWDGLLRRKNTPERPSPED